MSGGPLQALRFVVPARHVEAATTLFEETALSVTAFEHEGDGREDAAFWLIEALFEEPPALAALQADLDVLEATERRVEPLPDADWLAEVARAVKPIHVGPFFIHGAQYRDECPAEAIGIEIDAGLAFGSGEHPTTRACLRAMLQLGEEFDPASLLDMGCGSAVLAIAAAKFWPAARVVGVEIDARAAAVAAGNAALNGVDDRVAIVAGDGYDAPIVGAHAPYDLIFANILPDPVIAMAVDARRMIATSGFLIVSGLLERSIGDVTDAHVAAGFETAGEIVDDGWVALTFRAV